MTDEVVHRDDDPELLIAEIAEEFLQRIEQGEYPDVSEYAERYPGLAEVLQQVLPALTMVGSAREVWAQKDLDSELDLSPDRTLGDFKIKREIGRGGMGVVYEAQEMSLGRRVALKVLPFAGLLDPRQLERFKMEAQVAAQLHHTHIVPVFSVGKERGVHYYAMQYVDGQSLAAVIRQLKGEMCGKTVGTQARSVNSPSFHLTRTGSTQTPDYIRAVTRIGIQAAEALQHAHDHGVLHRDIKPSNLLLDLGGHLWITDFGLARYQRASAASLTLPGDVVGTLRYMSPEQAAGRSSIVDERTDIYSLGATLYELLSLEPILSGRERHELHHQIEDETPRSLCRLNPAVPVDLETIILKSLAKVPQDRYVTCRQLAEDLQRFLEHRPIQARRPTWTERIVKWSRRHRPLVTAALVVLGVAVVALGVSTVLIWQEKRRTEFALADVEDERRRAQSNYERARDAVDEMTRVVENQLAGPSALASTRRELLLKAQAFYDGFLKSYTDDRVVSFEVARAYQRISTLYMKLGQYQQAQQALNEAVKVLDRLTQIDSDQRVLLGDLYLDLGNALFEQGGLSSSRSCYVNAIDIHREVLEQTPLDPQAQMRLAQACLTFGAKLWHADDRQQALEYYRQGTDLKRILAEAYPENLTYQKEMAIDLAVMGRVLWETHKRFEADSVMRQSIQHFEQLELDFPNRMREQWPQVRARMIWAMALWQDNRVSECDAQIRKARTLQQRLLTPTSDDPMYMWSLAWNQMALMNVLRHMERLDEAVEACNKAVTLKEGVVAAFRHEPNYRSSLASDYVELGDLLRRLEQWHDANRIYKKAVTSGRRLADEFPRRLDHQISLVRACLGRVRVLDALGRPREAQDLFQYTKRCQVKLLTHMPKEENWNWRVTWGWSLPAVMVNSIRIAEIQSDWALPEQAAQTYIDMVEKNPDNAYCWYARAMGQWRAGDRQAYESTCRLMLDRFRGTSVCQDARLVAWTCSMAEVAFDEGSGLMSLLDTVNQHDKSPVEKGNSQIVIGALLYRAGRFEEAARELTNMIRLWDEGLEKPRYYSPVYANCFLAMTHARLGHYDQAAEQLARAKDTIEQDEKGYVSWYKRTTCKHLLAETESVLRDLNGEVDEF